MPIQTNRLTAHLLREILPQPIFDKLTYNETFDAEISLIKHLLGVTSYIQYSREMQEYFKVPLVKALRNAMLEKFDLAVKLKFSLLAILRKRNAAPDFAAKTFSSYGISNHVALIEGLREQRSYTKAIIRARSIKMPLESEREMIDRCAYVLEYIREGVNKFVWRKHAFIVKNWGVKAEDIFSDLRVKAIKAFYSMMPFLEWEHVLNAVKRAIHNTGINIIKYHTAARRTQLVKEGEGFSRTTIGIEYRSDAQGGGNTKSDGNGAMEQHHEVFKSTRDPRFDIVDMRLSLESLMATHGKHPNKRAVLELVQMQQNTQFVSAAQVMYPETVRRVRTTEDVMDVLGSTKFLEAVRRHVGVQREHFYGFIGVVQQAL